MFGYVRPYKDEIKIKEFEIFKNYYCGTCVAVGKHNYLGRFLLNYDSVFLSLFLSSLFLDSEIPKKKFCPFVFKKVNIYSNKYIDYSASLNIFLVSKKLFDDYKDNKNFFALLGAKMLDTKSQNFEKVDSLLNKIWELEKKECNDIDKLTDLFGEILETFTEIEEVKLRKDYAAIRFFSYNLGRWIYLIDAIDDYEKDVKKGKFNPLKDKFNKDMLKFILANYIKNIQNAFELIDFKKNRPIIENVVYFGLPKRIEEILNKNTCKAR